jgi:hypothetical protein
MINHGAMLKARRETKQATISCSSVQKEIKLKVYNFIRNNVRVKWLRLLA